MKYTEYGSARNREVLQCSLFDFIRTLLKPLRSAVLQSLLMTYTCLARHKSIYLGDGGAVARGLQHHAQRKKNRSNTQARTGAHERSAASVDSLLRTVPMGAEEVDVDAGRGRPWRCVS